MTTNFPQWVLGICGSLVVGGVGAVATSQLTSARAAAATEERVHAMATRLDEHAEQLSEHTLAQVRAEKLLERIDERVGEMVRRLDRVERKIDEPKGRR